MDTDGPIGAVLRRLHARLERMQAEGDDRRFFHAVYTRTTQAVATALDEGRFLDRRWVERWDVAFAELYLVALAAADRGDAVPAPWAIAFAAAGRPGGEPLRHVLLGMNAHINYDLPQALLAVIPSTDFADPGLVERRRADHSRIDDVLQERVGAEDDALAEVGLPRTPVDRLLGPLNRLGTARFLRESRTKVWANTQVLQTARTAGPVLYEARLAELEQLTAAKVAQLEAPGQVLLRLAVRGFGVRLRAD